MRMFISKLKSTEVGGMVSLISKVVRFLEEDRRGSVSLVIEVADDLDEVSFLAELEDLARKYGKEVKIACDVLTEEDLIDLEADRYYDRLKEAGKFGV